MSTAEIIEQIRNLPPDEQVQVIEFAFELARSRPLTKTELVTLAQRMVDTNDPAEAERLKTSIVGGFYGK